MPATPSATDVARYARDGFLSPNRALTPAQAAVCRDKLEAFERALGARFNAFYKIDRVRQPAEPPEDDFLVRADKNPNTRGAAGVCGPVPPAPMQDLAAAIAMGRFSGVLALGSETKDLADAASLKNAGLSVVITAHEGPLAATATVILPASSWAEVTGTYVNAKGMTQESEQAIGPIGASRPAWKLLAALAIRLGQDFGWRKLSDVRDAMARGSASIPPGSPRAVGASS